MRATKIIATTIALATVWCAPYTAASGVSPASKSLKASTTQSAPTFVSTKATTINVDGITGKLNYYIEHSSGTVYVSTGGISRTMGNGNNCTNTMLKTQIQGHNVQFFSGRNYVIVDGKQVTMSGRVGNYYARCSFGYNAPLIPETWLKTLFKGVSINSKTHAITVNTQPQASTSQSTGSASSSGVITQSTQSDTGSDSSPSSDDSLAGKVMDTNMDGEPVTTDDGLPDFQNTNKYMIPTNDTVADGTWSGRRNHTYSVEATLKILKPVNLQAMNDDYQDVKLISEDATSVTVQVVLYPFNTNKQAITPDSNWKKDDASMTQYLKPGLTTNWNAQMQADLRTKLIAAGINPDETNDVDLVQKVSNWLVSSFKSYNNEFDFMYVYFPNSVPTIYSGLESAFESNKGNPLWSTTQQFENEILGRQMFYNNDHGTCTSSSVLWATVFRALGIPTRIITTIPVINANDANQVDMVKNNIHDYQVQDTILRNASSAGGFSNHNFVEVYVGKHWIRLNYNVVGQNILDLYYDGLQVHVDTELDSTDAGLWQWGADQEGVGTASFMDGNPYECLGLSDEFGKYSHIPNPKAPELTELDINAADWSGDNHIPSSLALDTNNQFVILFPAWIAGEDYTQLHPIRTKYGQAFMLKADGHPDVTAQLSGNLYSNGSGTYQGAGVSISPGELTKMVPGVAYSIVPQNVSDTYKWTVMSGVTITRPVGQ